MGVPAYFHSRYDAISRTYLYKLAIFPKLGTFLDHDQRFHQWMDLPIDSSSVKQRKMRRKKQAINECLMTKLSLLESDAVCDLFLKEGQTFDFELFKQTLKLMEGTHNFSNFSKTQGLFKYKTVDGERYTPVARTEEERTKTLNYIDVLDHLPPLPASIYPVYHDNGVKFIDVVIQGQSFLHNQVRRMVGAALTVAIGKINIDNVKLLLDNPDIGWNNKITPAPARGLYLAKVEYNPEALTLATDNYEDMLNLEKVIYNPEYDQDDTEEVCDNLTGSHNNI